VYSSSFSGFCVTASVGLVDGPVVGRVVALEAEPFIRRASSFFSTASSASHNATSRTPFIFEKASVWLLPRPLRPMVPMRMSSLDPTTAAQDLAVHGMLTAAAATAVPLSRRRRLIIEWLIEMLGGRR